MRSLLAEAEICSPSAASALRSAGGYSTGSPATGTVTAAAGACAERELKLVFLAERPGLHTPRPQIARKRAGKAVQREHELRLHQLDIAHEIRVIGVIGERKGGVAAVAEFRAGIERPAGKDGGAAIAGSAAA